MRRTAISRREFLGAAAGAGLLATRGTAAGEPAAPAPAASGLPPGIPLADLHVHLDSSTIDKVVEISRGRGVKFGCVEHAGTKENAYPVVLSSDADLARWIGMLEGKGVWKGVQAEYDDWVGCFSREALARLDYILTDTMTFPGKDGKRAKMWEPAFRPGDPESFMDRYVDWHLRLLETAPVDLLANVSWLPDPLGKDHDRYWTEKRIAKVLDAAKKHGVAFEISASFKLPQARFLKMAREAGIQLCFGSNGRYPNMGKLDWSLERAKALGLKPEEIFVPAPAGKRAVDRRKDLTKVYRK